MASPFAFLTLDSLTDGDDDNLDRLACTTFSSLVKDAETDNSNNDNNHETLANPLHWTLVSNLSNCKIFSKLLNKSGESLHVYKVLGEYDDIPAIAFFQAQVDIDKRRSWDNLVISIDFVQDPSEGKDIVKWIAKYPTPMSPREYIFTRRYDVFDENRLILVSKALDCDAYPKEKNTVRVENYLSVLLVRPKPNRSVFENGFEYILIYYEDSKSVIPTQIYNYGVTKGVQNFLSNVHRAAQRMQFEESEYIHDKLKRNSQDRGKELAKESKDPNKSLQPFSSFKFFELECNEILYHFKLTMLETLSHYSSISFHERICDINT